MQGRCWISIDRRTERGRKQNIVAGFVTRVRRSEAGNLRQIAVNQRQECLIESFDRSVKGLAGDVIGSVANQDRRGEGWDMIQPIEHPAKNTRPRWSICYWSFSLGSQLLWRPCILKEGTKGGPNMIKRMEKVSGDIIFLSSAVMGCG